MYLLHYSYRFSASLIVLEQYEYIDTVLAQPLQKNILDKKIDDDDDENHMDKMAIMADFFHLGI